SLAAGVAVLHALAEYGLAARSVNRRGKRAHAASVPAAAGVLGLKWPNDILWNDRKLAGLLVDVHGEASGPCTIVLGLGLNCQITGHDAKRIDQPWVDL